MGLSLGNGVHGSVDVASWKEEEVARGVTGRLLVDKPADEQSEASPFLQAAMELIVEFVSSAEARLESTVVCIRSVAGGGSVVPSSSLASVPAVGTPVDGEDEKESCDDDGEPFVPCVPHTDTVPPVGSTS